MRNKLFIFILMILAVLSCEAKNKNRQDWNMLLRLSANAAEQPSDSSLFGQVVSGIWGVSVTATNGITGAAHRFSLGAVSGIQIAMDGAISNTCPSTVVCWVYDDGGGNGSDPTFIFKKAATNTGGSGDLNVDTLNNSNLYAANMWGSFTTPFSTSTWYHFVIVMDAARNATVFLNGIPKASGNLAVADAPPAYFMVGASAASNRYGSWSGLLAEFRWFNRNLTTNEVFQIYQQDLIATGHY